MDDATDRKRIIFIWLVPLMWAVGSLLQRRAAGDENAFYVASSLPGIWLGILGSMGARSVSKEMLAILVVLAGAPIMAMLGWAMDYLQVRKRVWAVVYIVGAIGILALTLSGYDSIQHAINKNGSLQAYVLLALNLGLFLSVLVATFFFGIRRCVMRFREPA
jgi:hypothetical protein